MKYAIICRKCFKSKIVPEDFESVDDILESFCVEHMHAGTVDVDVAEEVDADKNLFRGLGPLIVPGRVLN